MHPLPGVCVSVWRLQVLDRSDPGPSVVLSPAPVDYAARDATRSAGIRLGRKGCSKKPRKRHRPWQS